MYPHLEHALWSANFHHRSSYPYSTTLSSPQVLPGPRHVVNWVVKDTLRRLILQPLPCRTKLVGGCGMGEELVKPLFEGAPHVLAWVQVGTGGSMELGWEAVTERCVSNTNLDLATPNFTELCRTSPNIPEKPATLPPDHIHDVPISSTILSDGVSDQPPRQPFCTWLPRTTVLYQSPRTSRTNRCNSSAAHLTKRDLSNGAYKAGQWRTKLDEHRR